MRHSSLAAKLRRDRLHKRARHVWFATQRRVFEFEDRGQTAKFERMIRNCERIMAATAKPGKVGVR